MSRSSQIGAAVIGSGFIGTVHIEALRRIGVQVRGVLGSTPGTRGRPGATRSASRGRTPRSTRCSTIRASTSSTSPRPTTSTSPQAEADPRRRPPRRLREAAGDDRRGVGRARRPAAAERQGRRGQLQHPLLPAQPARCARSSRTAGSATSASSPATTSRTGCSSRRDWNWRLEPDSGGALRAVGDIGSHWLDLTTFDHRPARRRGHGRPGDVRAAPPGADAVRSRRSRRSGRPTRSTREMETEDVATILLRFENGARGAVAISQISAGRKNSLQWEIDGSQRGRRVGLRAARPAVARPSRPAERDPHPQPGADEPGRPGRGGAAGRPRRGLRRHVRRAVPGGLRRRRRGPPVRRPALRDVRRRPRRDARRRRDRATAPGSGRWVEVVAPAAGSQLRRRPPDEARLPDRAVPRDAAHGRRRLGGRQRLREPRDRLLAAVERPDPTLRRHVAHRRRQPVARARRRRSRRDRGQGPGTSPASATTRTRSTRTPPIATRSSATSSQVIVAAGKMGVPFVNTFMGGDAAKNQDENWEEALEVWPDIVRHAQDHGVQAHDRELPDDLQLRRVAGRPQHRLVAVHLAPDPRDSGAARSGSTTTRRTSSG